MRNYVLARAATAALLAAQPVSAQEQGPTVLERINGSGQGISFNFTDVGDRSFVFFNINGGALCSGSLDASDLVDISTTAKSGTGSIDHVIDELDCDFGMPPSSMSVECEENGIFEVHFVGNQTITSQGERRKFHGTGWLNNAECSMQVDGEEFDLTNGELFRAKENN